MTGFTNDSTETYQENKGIRLSTVKPFGGISRLIQFTMTTENDRPWISWLDEFGTHVVASGYHSRDIVSGQYHNAYEIKTVALDGIDMRTRFSVGTKTDRVQVGFAYCDTLEINQNEIPATPTAFGLKLRAPKATDINTDGNIFQVLATPNADDTVTINMDAMTLDSTKACNFVINRNQNTSSGSTGIFIKKGDNTNTDMMSIMNRTGVIRIYNAFTVPTGNVTGAGQLYVTGGALVYRSAAGTVTTIGPA